MITDLTEREILERVDEYSLFCFYLEFQPVIGAKYKSNLRDGDDFASFGVYERKVIKTNGMGDFPNEFLWKDQALPGKNFGDIFDLVRVLYKLPHRLNALWKVCGDFGLGEGYEVQKTLVKVEPVRYPPTKITVQSRPFDYRDLSYWSKYNVNEAILAQYNCTAVKYYKLNDLQEYPNVPKQCYAYRINNRYQLYQPFLSKDLKFRNNWTEADIPGGEQQDSNNLCIITKAYKDVMSLRGFGYNAIAPRGENIILPEEAIGVLKERYQQVLVLFDNDGKHGGAMYPFDKIFVPIESGTKDITDYCAKYGVAATHNLLKELVNGISGR